MSHFVAPHLDEMDRYDPSPSELLYAIYAGDEVISIVRGSEFEAWSIARISSQFDPDQRHHRPHLITGDEDDIDQIADPDLTLYPAKPLIDWYRSKGII